MSRYSKYNKPEFAAYRIGYYVHDERKNGRTGEDFPDAEAMRSRIEELFVKRVTTKVKTYGLTQTTDAWTNKKVDRWQELSDRAPVDPIAEIKKNIDWVASSVERYTQVVAKEQEKLAGYEAELARLEALRDEA